MRQKRSLTLFLALAALAACLFCTPLFAAAKAEAPKKVPTAITSARMDYDANVQTVRFTGNVHVKRPDFEMWSESMTVYLDDSGKGQGGDSELAAGMDAGDIDRIVAIGKVRLKSESRVGTCDKATYFAKEDRFLMEGAPVLKDGKQSTISGGRIVHYFSTNRSEVLQDPHVIFYAPDKTEGGKKNGPAMEGVKP